MKSLGHRVRLVAVIACTSLAAACGGDGSSVQGNTYEGNGGVFKIEFQSGGKAFAWTGPVSTPCTYAQNAKKVDVTCEGDKIDFTVNDDGSLTGPPNGLVSRLTKKKA